jgi:hypothetical protein
MNTPASINRNRSPHAIFLLVAECSSTLAQSPDSQLSIGQIRLTLEDQRLSARLQTTGGNLSDSDIIWLLFSLNIVNKYRYVKCK